MLSNKKGFSLTLCDTLNLSLFGLNILLLIQENQVLTGWVFDFL